MHLSVSISIMIMSGEENHLVTFSIVQQIMNNPFPSLHTPDEEEILRSWEDALVGKMFAAHA